MTIIIISSQEVRYAAIFPSVILRAIELSPYCHMCFLLIDHTRFRNKRIEMHISCDQQMPVTNVGVHISIESIARLSPFERARENARAAPWTIDTCGANTRSIAATPAKPHSSSSPSSNSGGICILRASPSLFSTANEFEPGRGPLTGLPSALSSLRCAVRWRRSNACRTCWPSCRRRTPRRHPHVTCSYVQ